VEYGVLQFVRGGSNEVGTSCRWRFGFGMKKGQTIDGYGGCPALMYLNLCSGPHLYVIFFCFLIFFDLPISSLFILHDNL